MLSKLVELLRSKKLDLAVPNPPPLDDDHLLTLSCEGLNCGVMTLVHEQDDGSMICYECIEASKRRTRLAKGWDDQDDDAEGQVLEFVSKYNG